MCVRAFVSVCKRNYTYIHTQTHADKRKVLLTETNYTVWAGKIHESFASALTQS